MSGEECGSVGVDEGNFQATEAFAGLEGTVASDGAVSVEVVVDGDAEVPDSSPRVRRRGHGVRLIMAGAVMAGGALGAASEAGASGQCSPDGVRVVSVAGAVSEAGVGGGPGTLSVERYNLGDLSPSEVAKHQPALTDDGKITRADIGKNVLVLDRCDPSPKQVSRVKSKLKMRREVTPMNALTKDPGIVQKNKN